MATMASSEHLKADGWGDVNEAADVTVRGEDHTSVVLRPNHPLILVRGTLHGCWPDQAALTPEQALDLADALRGMARRMGAREAAPAAKPAKARRRKAGAGEPGVIPTPPRDDDDREAIAEGDHHLYHPKAAAPDTTPNAIAGALADGASDDGLALNAGCGVIKVISGGQTGVDQAALRAAKACGLPTGGYAPKGWQTEDGPSPWLADYGLVECGRPGYPARTGDNVATADAVLWIGDMLSPGGRLTLRLARQRGLLESCYSSPEAMLPSLAADWLRLIFPGGGRLLVAGNRESTAPGIGAAAERVLIEVFNGVKCNRN